MLFGVPLHPMTIHFPIVLFLTGTLALLISLFKEKTFFITAAYYIYGLGILAGGIAILSGRAQAALIAHNETIHEMMELHETLAYLFVGLMAVLFIWMYIRKNLLKKAEHIMLIIFAFSIAGLLAYQSHIGGRMVYQEGAGVKPMEKVLEQGHDHNHTHGEEPTHEH